MAWIETIDEADAAGEVKAHYDEAREIWGFVPNIRKVNSIKPDLMLQLHAFSHQGNRARACCDTGSWY